MELEEQLRVVTFQRRKAENAMVDVLISLEKNGFSYFSEEIHSGSDDNGINTESRISDNSGREFCTSPGRSLLQKSFKCCRNHNGKIHGDRGRRRRTSSTSNGGSTPKALGKSICQTEQGENRSALECQLFFLLEMMRKLMYPFVSLACMQIFIPFCKGICPTIDGSHIKHL